MKVEYLANKLNEHFVGLLKR